MVKDVHKYDVLRGDGCISQNGIESRIPFHDQDLINIAF
jgi:asparagine synthetase B (glutamine-hydrolysing)